MKTLHAKLTLLVLSLLPLAVYASNDTGTGSPETGRLIELWQWLLQSLSF